MKTFAERLKYARECASMTQQMLADKSGLSQGQIGHLESGLRQKSTKTITIAQVLGVNAEWLEKGIGQMIPVQAAELVRNMTEDECSLVLAYRGASLEGKRLLVKTAEFVYNIQNSDKNL